MGDLIFCFIRGTAREVSTAVPGALCRRIKQQVDYVMSFL